jgi:xylulose-5-phosphate/fructose-6-phosphate phosphoketolase
VGKQRSRQRTRRVLACAGDIPTLETLAAVDLLRHYIPNLKIRVINIVDLMTLQPKTQHPHGLTNKDFDDMFTTDKPVIFAYHGYPWLIHRLAYKRTNHDNIHVLGYEEEGSTTTPFDIAVRNGIDSFHLVLDVINRVPKLGASAVYAKQEIRARLIEHKRFISEHGTDMPDIQDWRWRNTH